MGIAIGIANSLVKYFTVCYVNGSSVAHIPMAILQHKLLQAGLAGAIIEVVYERSPLAKGGYSFMKYSKGEFTQVPNKSARRGLPPAEQVVLMWLADHSDDNEQCYPSRRILAEECGLSVRSLDRALASLIERGLIVKSDRYIHGRQTSNMYEVVILAGEGDKNDTPGATKTTRGRATKTTHRTQPIKNSTHLTHVDALASTATAPVAYGAPEINELFDYWEQILGYRVEGQRQRNRNACSNLVKKHGVDGVRRLIQGVAKASNDRFAPRIADFTQLQARYNELIAWGRRTVVNENKSTEIF